ncbi:MAG: type ISP restriction/modification enzyme [Rhodovibrio sp.]|nr:type ISP restriction/modification enzyme [Rhodovibrio sp.]
MIAGDYELWPALREIALADSFSGLQEMRKGALISIDANVLAPRIQRYLNPKINFSTLRDENCGPVQPAGRFDPKEARNRIINEEGYDPKNIRRYTMYPLDNRWCYHSGIRPIWNEPRPELAQQMEDDNLCIVTRMSGRQPKEGVPIMATRSLPNYHLLDPNAHAFPIHIRTRPDAKGLFSGDGEAEKANLSERVRSWLADLGRPVPDNDSKSATAPWLHALAIGFAPAWLEEHKAAIFAGWPRVPLPATAADLSWSAELGARLAALLDPDRAVPSVTGGTLVAPFRVLGAMARVDGKGLKPEDLALTAGWGRGGGGKPVMPGNGRTVTRERYSEEEHAQIDAAAVARGEATVEGA